MNVIKENLLLSMGILLPFLLMAIFLISSVVTKSTLPPPQHSFLFTTNGYERLSQAHGIYYTIEKGRLKAHLSKPATGPDAMRVPTENQKLYFYDATTNNTQEITAEITDQDTVELDRFQNAKLDIKTTAPDGYEFTNNRYNNTGLIGDIFGVNRYNDRTYYLIQDSAVYPVKLPVTDNRYYNVQFLGWVQDAE